VTVVNIFPPNAAPATAGTYTSSAGTAFTMTSDGRGFYPNMTLNPTWNGASWDYPDKDLTGDLMTYAYETISGDFDRRLKITSISADTATDTWTRGGLMLRTDTNHYKASLQIIAANPQGQNQVTVCGRALDGQNYTEFDRRLGGVTNALPNQWLRLRRVGDYFTAYVGTNGTAWTLVAQRYQVLPSTLLVGPYAASGTIGTVATVQFDNYGPTPTTDATPPTLISAGTLDKKQVGVRFSEPLKA